MSEVRTETPGVSPTSPTGGDAARTDGSSNGVEPQAMTTRVKVVVHRLDGGLEEGESDARSFVNDGYRIFSTADPDHPRMIPAGDIKYIVFGSPEDPSLEPDPGDKTDARKAILRFRDGEWIAAYMPQGQVPDSAGLSTHVRLAGSHRLLPAPPTPPPRPA